MRKANISHADHASEDAWDAVASYHARRRRYDGTDIWEKRVLMGRNPYLLYSDRSRLRAERRTRARRYGFTREVVREMQRHFAVRTVSAE